ncbi:hypothetical protein [Xanthomarina sp. F2636L]|uniref:hypothetical protein n=1 Tax=Xanthomarina sp. F2636L TaxID=2996018 RepID=UPI00225E49F9|nr:hypothetical protein [Xanthomarina sp. F2636L]MCX7551421.1 hypothetical protein [Xanthomarina sp. F2636L]
MKYALLLFLVTFNLSLSAQSEKITGKYVKTLNTDSGDVMTWTIRLNSDRTFLYHFQINNKNEELKEENVFGKGIWRSQRGLVFFTTNDKDLDKIHTLNFSNSRARIHIDASKNTFIVFYDSDISEIKELELLKEAN